MQAEREARENVTPSLLEDTIWVRPTFVDHAGIPKAKPFIGTASGGVRRQAWTSPRECSHSSSQT